MPFRDLVGHAHLRELLASAAIRGTLPASLIFAGPEGVGKRQTATALAQLVNCLSPGESDACGVCAACTRIARGVHVDILTVEPGDTVTRIISVDQIRDVIERTGYRPFEGRRRVVIIDDADAMLGPAQDALLKRLEEPPTASMFVLVTPRLDLLSPTIRSRCQQLRFGRLSTDEIASELVKTHGFESAEAHVVAAAAGGSIGLALEGGTDEVVEAREAAADALQAVAVSSDPRRRLDGAKLLAGGGDRDDLRRRLRALASLLRDLGVLTARADERHLANADYRPRLTKLTGAFDADRITGAFGAIDRALEAIDRNGSPKIVADWLVFQL
jgi:DNA polymerase-3 subunit delta'